MRVLHVRFGGDDKRRSGKFGSMTSVIGLSHCSLSKDPPEIYPGTGSHSSIQVTMDTYGHLFPSRIQGWTNTLDDVPRDGENAPQTHPEAKTQEQESYKLRKKLVAVTRIERVTRGL